MNTMIKIMTQMITLMLMMITLGCISKYNHSSYIEGTTLTLGLYLPYNGSVYGIQAVNFMTGKRLVISSTNDFPNIQSELITSNKLLTTSNQFKTN